MNSKWPLAPLPFTFASISEKSKLIGFNERFEVFMVVTKKKGVFWEVTPSGSCKN
jgi:hypothetical protein